MTDVSAQQRTRRSSFQAVVGGPVLVNEIFTTFKIESCPYLEKILYL